MENIVKKIEFSIKSYLCHESLGARLDDVVNWKPLIQNRNKYRKSEEANEKVVTSINENYRST